MRKIVLALAALASAWASAALYFDVRIPWMRVPVACLYLFIAGAIIWFTRTNRHGILLWVGSLILVVAWWLSLAPSNTHGGRALEGQDSSYPHNLAVPVRQVARRCVWFSSSDSPKACRVS